MPLMLAGKLNRVVLQISPEIAVEGDLFARGQTFQQQRLQSRRLLLCLRLPKQ